MKVNLLKFSPRARETIDEILKPTTPNLYATPVASPSVRAQPPTTPPRTYELERPWTFHASTLSTALLDPKVELASQSIAVFVDFESERIGDDYPTTAAGLQAISIFVGGYGCLEKLLKPDEYTRWRRGFCVSDFLLGGLNFRSNYIPQLSSLSPWLLGIRFVVKLSDGVAIYNVKATKKREFLKAVKEA